MSKTIKFYKIFFFFCFFLSLAVTCSFFSWLGIDSFEPVQSRLEMSYVFIWTDFPCSFKTFLWTKSESCFETISVHVCLVLNRFPNLCTFASSNASSFPSSRWNSTNTNFDFSMVFSCIHENMRLYFIERNSKSSICMTSTSFFFLKFSYLTIEVSIAFNFQSWFYFF